VTATGLVVSIGLSLVGPGTAGAASPAVTISPGPGGAGYNDGQLVTVSVGPNSLFHPNHSIAILECADPNGTVANLPTSFSTCDGDTHQGDTVIVSNDGSISEPDYEMYALPNAKLDEQANWYPVCNKTHYCVLYVGEDYNDFSQPKLFSQPFLFSSDAPTLAGGTAGGSTSTPSAAGSAATGAGANAEAAGTSAGASADVSVPPGTLAFTGISAGTPWVVGLGLILLTSGALWRRRFRKAGR
jgi:LPXTG-motif cell wall-anchored protein